MGRVLRVSVTPTRAACHPAQHSQTRLGVHRRLVNPTVQSHHRFERGTADSASTTSSPPETPAKAPARPRTRCAHQHDKANGDPGLQGKSAPPNGRARI